MGHTGVSVRDRTVTKTCIKLPVVTVWDISSDSPLHWIPCHSSLNGQTDDFMHNWDLYYEKENEGSVSFLTLSGRWRKLEGRRGGERKEWQPPPPHPVDETGEKKLCWISSPSPTTHWAHSLSSLRRACDKLRGLSELSPLVYVEN